MVTTSGQVLNDAQVRIGANVKPKPMRVAGTAPGFLPYCQTSLHEPTGGIQVSLLNPTLLFRLD
jgi:hypothetical protein